MGWVGVVTTSSSKPRCCHSLSVLILLRSSCRYSRLILLRFSFRRTVSYYRDYDIFHDFLGIIPYRIEKFERSVQVQYVSLSFRPAITKARTPYYDTCDHPRRQSGERLVVRSEASCAVEGCWTWTKHTQQASKKQKAKEQPRQKQKTPNHAIAIVGVGRRFAQCVNGRHPRSICGVDNVATTIIIIITTTQQH